MNDAMNSITMYFGIAAASTSHKYSECVGGHKMAIKLNYVVRYTMATPTTVPVN